MYKQIVWKDLPKMADIKLPFEDAQDAEAEVVESTLHAPVRNMTFEHFRERMEREEAQRASEANMPDFVKKFYKILDDNEK